MTFRTKQGTHGTLYLYSLQYKDDVEADDVGYEGTWKTWAYDATDALDRFYGAPDADGWVHTSEPQRVKEKVTPW
jgi:hypothetical protein